MTRKFDSENYKTKFFGINFLAIVNNFCSVNSSLLPDYYFFATIQQAKANKFLGASLIVHSLFVHCSMVVRSSFDHPSLFLRSSFASEAKERPEHRDSMTGD